MARMGGTTGTRLITAEEGAVMVDELEATAPMIEQQYSDADAVAIRSALTDADLFLSYNMNGAPIGTIPTTIRQRPNAILVVPIAGSAAHREAVLGDITSKFPAARRVQVSLLNSAMPTTGSVSHVISR